MSEQPRVAFLGLGRMGEPMAARLLDGGFPLTVWNRTAERAAGLVARGARRAETPADAARDAEIVVSMLADPGAVDAVLLAQGGAIDALAPGALLVDCSTIGPAQSRALGARCGEREARFVDAPVLGSTPAAAQGTLTVLVGGDADTVMTARPVLERFGARVVHAGPVGSGTALKLVMNLLVGGLTELLAEGIVLAERAGLDAGVVRETLGASVLASPFLGYKAPQLFDRQFAPLFTAALMRKDLDLVLEEARAHGLALVGAAAVRDAYVATVEAGHGDDDFAAVIAHVESARG